MQQINLLSVSSRNESVDFRTNNHAVQGEQMTCPNCEALCLSMGKVNKNWYTLCCCGTYIQKCANGDDYRD